MRSQLYLLSTTRTQHHLTSPLCWLETLEVKVNSHFLHNFCSLRFRTGRVPRISPGHSPERSPSSIEGSRPFLKRIQTAHSWLRFVKMALNVDPTIVEVGGSNEYIRGTLYCRDPHILIWHWHLSHMYLGIDGCREREDMRLHFLHVRGASHELLA